MYFTFEFWHVLKHGPLALLVAALISLGKVLTPPFFTKAWLWFSSSENEPCSLRHIRENVAQKLSKSYLCLLQKEIGDFCPWSCIRGGTSWAAWHTLSVPQRTTDKLVHCEGIQPTRKKAKPFLTVLLNEASHKNLLL